jgi:hypothetical protein
MMAKFQEGVLRGSSKTTSDSPKRTRLSITFFLEDRAIISRFFLEDHDAISKKFLEDSKTISKFFLEHLTCNSNFFQTRYARLLVCKLTNQNNGI